MKKTKTNSQDENRQSPPEVEVFCDARDTSYWFKVNGRYLRLGARDLRLHLRAEHGLNEKFYINTGDVGSLRQIDYPLWNAQKNFLIDYAGALAGHRVGIFQKGGKKFLVTEEPGEMFESLDKSAAKPKKPKWFCSFIEELLGDQDQHLFFSYWLQFALRSLQRGDFRPGQVCVFAGQSECGKSLLQAIITEIFGGRSANPFRYMMGESQFNFDLAGAEHWQIEDPASTTDMRTRRLFGSKLKECTVNGDFSIHQKGKDALLLQIFRRVTISVNDEPENLAVIPPLDDSIKDKIFLFLCNRVEKAFEPFKDDNGVLDRKGIWQTVMGEIPAIRAWLLNGLPKLPRALGNVRFGVKAWHHPVLLTELENLSPESRLLALIDEAVFKDWQKEDLHFWEGKSIELEKLLNNSSFAFEASKILRYSGSAGAYLARLEKSHPERISRRTVHGYTVWKIQKPKTENDDKDQMLLGTTPFAEDAGLVKRK